MISHLLRAWLLDLLGRADDAWFSFYQGALCRLGEDCEQADARYEQAARHAEVDAWRFLVARLHRRTTAVLREPGGEA